MTGAPLIPLLTPEGLPKATDKCLAKKLNFADEIFGTLKNMGKAPQERTPASPRGMRTVFARAFFQNLAVTPAYPSMDYIQRNKSPKFHSYLHAASRDSQPCVSPFPDNDPEAASLALNYCSLSRNLVFLQ